MRNLLKPELHGQRDLYKRAADEWRNLVGNLLLDAAGGMVTFGGIEAHSTPLAAIGGAMAAMGILATKKTVGQLHKTSVEFGSRLEATASSSS